MNFKNTKDTIIRVVKDFIGVTAVGAMFVLLCLLFCIDSITFSKEIIGLLLGTSILGLGIGGLTSAVLIFFNFCMKKISKLEKTIAEKDKVIDIQSAQLRNAKACSRPYHVPLNQQPATSSKSSDKKIFKEIEPLSEEVSLEEFPEQEICVDSELESTTQDDNVDENA